MNAKHTPGPLKAVKGNGEDPERQGGRTMNAPDERRGVPSASGMIRVVNCPASHQMERVAEAIAPEKRDDKDAAAGNVVHALLSGGETEDDVSYSAEATAEMCESQVDRLLLEWRFVGIPEPVQFTEVRYGMTIFGIVLEVTPESRAEFVFTGKFDRLYIQGERGLLIDFKALNGEHVKAVDNPQLASLAVLVSANHKLKSLRVAIVQPRKGRPTVADYDLLTLATAREWLEAALLRSAQATPDDRHAGKWCHHCKARLRCETFINAAHAVAEPLNAITIAGADGTAQRHASFARAMEQPASVHAAMVRGAPMLKRLYDSIMDAAKARAADDVEFQQYYRLEMKPGNREITDAQAAFTALSGLGVTHEDVLSACKLPIGAMEEAVRLRSGIKSQTEKRTTYNLTADAAKKAVDAALTSAGAIGRKADKTELVAVALEGGAE